MFFFFKQKTAYEMRISDWSSDVCSSDLHNEKSVVTYDYLFNFSELNIQKSFICASGITSENGVSDFDMQEAVTRKKMIERSKEIFEIGRASCRERVCQYV